MGLFASVNKEKRAEPGSENSCGKHMSLGYNKTTLNNTENFKKHIKECIDYDFKTWKLT